MTPIFETHCHYDDEAFDDDREQLLSGMAAAGISPLINVGASMESSRMSVDFANRFDSVYAAVGVHPSEVEGITESDMDELRNMALSDKRVVAIGEIGLDYHWPEPERDLQKHWFTRQMELAREVHLPIIIHSRDGEKDTEDLMRAAHAEEIGGELHCYSYSPESARAFLDMGFYIGIGGAVTFKNSKKLRRVVEMLPMDRILLETDCPYMAPEPVRGTRNNSTNLHFVAAKIAEIKGVSAEEVIAATRENATRLFLKRA